MTRDDHRILAAVEVAKVDLAGILYYCDLYNNKMKMIN